MWVGLVRKALRAKHEASWRRRNPARRAHQTPTWIMGCRLARPRKAMSQFLKINLFICILWVLFLWRTLTNAVISSGALGTTQMSEVCWGWMEDSMGAPLKGSSSYTVPQIVPVFWRFPEEARNPEFCTNLPNSKCRLLIQKHIS